MASPFNFNVNSTGGSSDANKSSNPFGTQSSGTGNKPTLSFGGAAGSGTASPFSGFGTTTNASQQPPSFNLGGSATSSAGTGTTVPQFGATAGTQDKAGTTTPSLFSGAGTAGKPLFGAGAALSDASKPVFPGATTSTQQQSASTETATKPAFFSAAGTQPSTTATSKPMFGAGASGTASPFSTGGAAAMPLFGSGDKKVTFGEKKDEQQPQQQTPLFGQKTDGQQAPLFGQKAKGQQQAPAPLFGQKQGEQAKPPALPAFGGLAAGGEKKDTAAPVFSLKKDDQTKPTLPSFGGAASTTTEKKDTSAPTGFSFGEKKDTATAPTTTGFSFGEKKDTTTTPSTGITFGDKKDTTTSTGLTFGEKKEAAAPDAATATTATATTTAPAAGAPATAAKETPAIQPGTYIKNKSFEDIIAKWTSALAKSADSFKSQASDIAAWDRVLVTNGEKITKLFADVIAAEQSHAKIDQLLQYIGKQQDDLESLLEQYEKDAAELVQGTSALGGGQAAAGATVDSERDEAYKLAVTLDEKLGNMDENLRGVIGEINRVSGDLTQSNNNEDDVVTQIVKILNAHLDSLQWIDANCSKLQERLNEMQSAEMQTREKLRF